MERKGYGVRAKARCPWCNNSIYRGGVIFRKRAYHKVCADAYKALLRRNKTNPGAAWHSQRATTLHERFRAGVDPGDTKSRMLENDFALIASRESNPEKKSRKPSRVRQTALGTYGGILLAIVTILGIAWIAEKSQVTSEA